MSLGRSVDELLRTVSSAELTEWAAFMQIEPFGPQADDYRAGIIAATVANVNRDPKTPALSPADFMPWHKTQDEPEQDESAQMKAFLGGLRGVTIKKKD